MESVLSELSEITRANPPVSLLVMVEFESGMHHVGAVGRYFKDPATMNAALVNLNEYLAWGRAHLESK